MKAGDVARIVAADGAVYGIFEKYEGKHYRVRVAGIALLFPRYSLSFTTVDVLDDSVVHTVRWANALASATRATGA